MAKARAATMSVAEARWAHHVARLGRSGLSVRKFAEQEGLKAGSLSFWKWKHGQRRGERAGADEAAPVRFVELRTKRAAAAVVAPVFEVVLATGRAVRVSGGFDAAELARLVGVLEETRS